MSGDPIIAQSQVGPGIYPLAQILVPADAVVAIPNGPDIGIRFNGKRYDVLGTLNSNGTSAAGAFLSGDPLAYLINPLAIQPKLDPEPSPIVLAGLGIVGMLLTRRRLN